MHVQNTHTHTQNARMHTYHTYMHTNNALMKVFVSLNLPHLRSNASLCSSGTQSVNKNVNNYILITFPVEL